MRLRYDEDFVEAAVFLCASGRRKGVPALHIARFNREREKLYSISEPDARNTAFFRLHLDWFREWGLEDLLTAPLKEFPRLPGALMLLAFRAARGRNDEGSELYINEADERTGVVALRPERLERDTALPAFLRHELAHLNDMVEPAFGYRPELPILGPAQSSHRLAHERYRLLWDVSIDGRLARAGRQTIATREQRWVELAGAFPFWTEARRQQVFDSLWNDPTPTHRRLVDLVCDPRELQAGAGPQPGAPCPLCGFPTFAWADGASLTDDALSAIRAEFPGWARQQGACARCAAIYRRRPALHPGRMNGPGQALGSGMPG